MPTKNSWTCRPLKMRPLPCLDMSGTDYRVTRSHIPEQNSQLTAGIPRFYNGSNGSGAVQLTCNLFRPYPNSRKENTN